jgi:fucose 4-O-acetylase-like acetyltransferase
MKTETKVVVTFLLFMTYGYFCVLTAETFSWVWNILADLGAATIVVLFFHFSFVREEHGREKMS